MRRGMAVAVAALAVTVAVPGAEAAQRGGTLNVLASGDVDYLDPGATYFQFGFQVAMTMHRTLYAYRPGEAKPVPDLAAGPPEVGDGGRTLTVRLRPGVRFEPPVDRAVVAGDVKYAIERAFSTSVGGQYVSYFQGLVGAPSPARVPRAPQGIEGVQAVDDRTLILRTRTANAGALAAALVLPITAPVPKEVAGPLDRRARSTYEQRPVASGAYRLTSRRAGRLMLLTRNPNWDPATDFRPAYADAIRIDLDVPGSVPTTERTLRGSMTVGADVVPAALVPRLRAAAPAQLAEAAAGGTRYLALNTRMNPFDDVDVRRGVLAGMDRTRLRATRGGAAAGLVPTHWLPPGTPGFEQAGGVAGPGLDFLRSPRADRRLARRYFRRAGSRSGRPPDHRPLLVVGANTDPGRSTAREAVRQLRGLGFRTRLRLLSQDRVYADFCQRPARRVAVCATAGWFKDYDDGESLLAPNFDGRAITREGNTNIAQLRSTGVNRAISAARLLPPGAERDAAWAQVDRRAMALAPVVPYTWDVSTLVRSADVDAAASPYFGLWDLTFTGRR
ncbi:ABC transporter substrate-binding protein [Conexibacter sp. SYSU D00693]|uniref:ABC transporter substrate-binding protein n=1 Tax=Conexibacter sp. SYSU D00693 TaxID=2812560 RepID=UPI00196B4F84|nr:ABC transporter substrate-binding protein [Conexibacter sp. SYSU D00693]